jgi:hypothetical protein
MYKFGDKLKAISSYEQLISKGDIVEIIDAQINNFITFRNRSNGVTSHWNWGAVMSYFVLLDRTPPKNDVEWLDRVQENFKNG